MRNLGGRGASVPAYLGCEEAARCGFLEEKGNLGRGSVSRDGGMESAGMEERERGNLVRTRGEEDDAHQNQLAAGHRAPWAWWPFAEDRALRPPCGQLGRLGRYGPPHAHARRGFSLPFSSKGVNVNIYSNLAPSNLVQQNKIIGLAREVVEVHCKHCLNFATC